MHMKLSDSCLWVFVTLDHLPPFFSFFSKDIEDLGILEFYDSSPVPFPNFPQKGTEMPDKTLDGTVCYHVQSIG